MFTKEIFALLIVNASNFRDTPPHDRHIRPPTHDRHLSALFENSPQATFILRQKHPLQRLYQNAVAVELFVVFCSSSMQDFSVIHHRTTATYDHQRTARFENRPQATFILRQKHPLQRLYQNAVAVELFVVFCSSSMQDFSVIHHRTTATYDHQRTIATSLHALKTDRKQCFSCNENVLCNTSTQTSPKSTNSNCADR